MSEQKVDEGMQFLYNWMGTFPGKNLCHRCHKKLGILGGKQVMARFGLSYNLCKDCYKEYKQMQIDISFPSKKETIMP